MKQLHTFMAVQMSGQPEGMILQSPSPLVVPCSSFWECYFRPAKWGVKAVGGKEEFTKQIIL